MTRMLVSPKRLYRELELLRFSLRRSCATTKEIDFSRPSAIPRIFEQLRVCGQGKLGEAVYAKTSVSASLNWLNDDCISSVDHSLMFALEADPERHWTILSNPDEAKLWESRLVQLADKACLKTTHEYERSLEIRLATEFATFDRYIEELGDMRSIF